jgi:dolichol-phosphate mannosyltransferase
VTEPAAAGLRIAVVIPMYNEVSGAAECVQAVCAELTHVPAGARLIVVDDGSTDGTAGVLAAAAARQPSVTVVTHDRNRGYGAALRSGVDEARRAGEEYVLFMDSDLTNAPSDIPTFVAKMREGADVIKATRYRGGGRMQGVPFGRRVVSRMGGLVARVLFHVGVSDCTNGFRAVRTRLLARMALRETRFPIIVEELYCCVFAARTFAEVPVVLTDRRGALRPTSFVYRPAVFWRYLKYAILAALRVPPGARLANEPQDAAGERR